MNRKNKPSAAFTRTVLSVVKGSFLSRNAALRQWPFLLYVTLLTVIYIALSHFADRTIRRMDALRTEMNELRSEYITTKFDLMYRSKMTEVARTAELLGLEIPVTPPYKIEVDKEEYESIRE